MMPNDSIHYSILLDCQAILQNQGRFGILTPDAIVVLKRMRAMPQQGFSKLPAMVLSPGRAVATVAGMNGAGVNEYGVKLCIIASNNLDAVTNQDMYQGWLEQAKLLLIREPADNGWRFSLPNVPQVFDVRESEDSVLPTEAADEMYDVLEEVVVFSTNE
jgi:hypothetical protein